MVDSFLAFCENVRHSFARQALIMSTYSKPKTCKETRSLLARHRGEMRELLDDKQLINLKNRAERLLNQLSADGNRVSK